MAAVRKAADDETDSVYDYPHSSNFRHYRDRRLLDGGPFVMLNLGTDGFQFFRRNGFEGWPVTATLLSMSPEERTRNKHQLLLFVTPGPRQPVNLESLIHPIADELNDLANGVSGRIVRNSATPVVLRAEVLNFNTDQPDGDKLANFNGASSYVYDRLRLFKGAYVPTSSHIYYPPRDPSNGKILFKVHDCTVARRSAASIAARAAEVEHVRASGRSVAFQTRLEQESGVTGYSLFFAPSPEAGAAYPHLQHLWDIGPTAAPYDTMHLVLLNVVPHLWKLFAGLKLVNKKKDEQYIIPKATVALIGQKFAGARHTVPRAQARSLRNTDAHHKSFKAVDWMHFILCSGEVLLAGRISGAFNNIFMAFCRACRLLFRPTGVTKVQTEAIDKDMKYFVANYFDKIYRGTAERLPLCLSTIATLLDIVPLVWACGPTWVVWQFSMERKIGTLGKLIRSASKPHASLVGNVTRHAKADLITSFGEEYLPREWAHAKPATPGVPVGSLTVPEVFGPDCALLPPKSAPAALNGAELASMRAVLIQEDATAVPPITLAKKNYLAKLASGKLSGSKLVGSDCDKPRRRNYLVRINSTEEFYRPDGTEGERPFTTFGAVLHYAAVYMDDRPMAFAYVERVKSVKDRPGRFGHAAVKHDIECILGLGGVPYYVPVAAVAEVVETIEREGVHFICTLGSRFPRDR